MANGFRNRPGGCGCRQALMGGTAYANLNYAPGPGNGPFYNGPCPGTRPVNGCPGWCRGTNGLPCGALGNLSEGETYGFFTQTGPLALTAGSGVPFSGPSRFQNLGQEYTQIRVPEGGVYLIEYHLTWPVSASINARFALHVNGEQAPGSDVRFMAESEGQAHSVSGQAIVLLCPQSAISLISDSDLQITPNAAADTVATLSIRRLE